MKTIFDPDRQPDIAWCPGCGNFGILGTVKAALAETGIPPRDLVLVSGIGQAAKLPQYVNANFFNGLHGRSLPAATGIKAANPGLTVIAVSGDGCSYGEGGNHFIHAIRRNPDITHLVHDNMVYGLTTGQASPTSRRGFKTAMQADGVNLEPFNPLAVAIALKASFVARAYAADAAQTKDIIKEAIANRGYSLVDIFQPCFTFNRVNTFQWFREHTFYLGADHDPYDRARAMSLAFMEDTFPLGILYRNKENKTFEENLSAYKGTAEPLYRRSVKADRLTALVDSRR